MTPSPEARRLVADVMREAVLVGKGDTAAVGRKHEAAAALIRYAMQLGGSGLSVQMHVHPLAFPLGSEREHMERALVYLAELESRKAAA